MATDPETLGVTAEDAPLKESKMLENSSVPLDAARKAMDVSRTSLIAYDGRLHERVTLSPRSRMKANGETKRCMEHAQAVKASQPDTSIDQPWSVDPSQSGRDLYVKIVSGFWFFFKFLTLFFPFILLQIPFMILLWIYARGLSTPCDSPVRESWSFQLYCILMFIVGLPMLLLACVSYLLDMIAYYFFSLIFCLVLCRWSKYCKSLKALAPYRGGPLIIFYWSDIVTALLGQIWRHGIRDCCCMLANTWLFIPWAKYFINVNPFIYDLEERMIQQISTSMQDMPLADIATAGLRIMSRTKQTVELKRHINKWRFAPHYPYPPPWKRWTIGLQAGGNQIPVVFFLFVHTTHAFSTHCRSTEQFVLSNSILAPGYRVMLWYNNPFHFFTGWVEASISTGGEGQADKNRGGEHPMWLVTGRSPLLADRWSMTGAGWIDNFFDEWLPTIVHEIRELTLGRKVADDYYEEVVSKDGASRPAQGKTVPLVDAGKAGRAMFQVTEEQLPILEIFKATE